MGGLGRLEREGGGHDLPGARLTFKFSNLIRPGKGGEHIQMKHVSILN
jgi:hypothetical protein